MPLSKQSHLNPMKFWTKIPENLQGSPLKLQCIGHIRIKFIYLQLQCFQVVSYFYTLHFYSLFPLLFDILWSFFFWERLTPAIKYDNSPHCSCCHMHSAITIHVLSFTTSPSRIFHASFSAVQYNCWTGSVKQALHCSASLHCYKLLIGLSCYKSFLLFISVWRSVQPYGFHYL